ncbi:hypothetical protein Caka_1996 [Coraliomargarita akajimensis DSM 45221]|uniref:Uncharacterized protein n=1 Tax=Coraliomargarita akajimensis (strain DSM 45221 / IAM 15411 / JCM 23193 / KCTC 12865 / 04OKA010-24) TaxID=583355 RepID=D5EKV7_CORAD|nr:hypothetical protein Caka_1996 [Coraliomargarita akajimensis DSM 45221]
MKSRQFLGFIPSCVLKEVRAEDEKECEKILSSSPAAINTLHPLATSHRKQQFHL